jgi:hypothetical protein
VTFAAPDNEGITCHVIEVISAHAGDMIVIGGDDLSRAGIGQDVDFLR